MEYALHIQLLSHFCRSKQLWGVRIDPNCPQKKKNVWINYNDLFENLFIVTEIQKGFLVEKILRIEKTLFDNYFIHKTLKSTSPF